MEENITDQLLYLFRSVLAGLSLGALYDVIRISRVLAGVCYSTKRADRLSALRLPLIGAGKARRENAFGKTALYIFIFAGDVLFCLLSGLLITVLVYAMGDGRVRAFALYGVAFGFAVYYFTAGRLVIGFSEYAAFFLRTAGRYAVFFVSVPILFLYKSLKCIILYLSAAVRSLYISLILSPLLEKKMIKLSENGFVPRDII